jgi:hypothetical protein
MNRHPTAPQSTKTVLLPLCLVVLATTVNACSPPDEAPTTSGAPGSTADHGVEKISQALYGTNRGTILHQGDVLWNGQSLVNNGYELWMQPDCNLVLYDWKDSDGCDTYPHYRVLWASNTDGQGSGCYATMQSDGNFVVYNSSRAVWASGTDGSANPGFVQLQSDSNVVVYYTSVDPRNARWSTGTWGVNPGGPTRNCTVPVTGAVVGRFYWPSYPGVVCGTTQMQLVGADGRTQVSPTLTGQVTFDQGKNKCVWQYTWFSVPAGTATVYGAGGGVWYRNTGTVNGGLTTRVDVNRDI